MGSNTTNELLDIKNKVKNSDLKQEKLEGYLSSISDDLTKTNKTRSLFYLFLLVVIMFLSGGTYYFAHGGYLDMGNVVDLEKIKQIQDVENGLQVELNKLKLEVDTYKNEIVIDTLNGSNDEISGQEVAAVIRNSNVKISSKSKFEKKYGIVHNVIKRNDVFFIEVNYIDFFEGKKAVKKAKTYGDVKYDIKPNGDTLYYLDSKYYVKRRDTIQRVLELDDKIKVPDVNMLSTGFPVTAFKKIIAKKPILVLKVNNGIVYEIKVKKLSK